MITFKDLPDKTTPINAANLNANFTELIDILHPVGEYYETSNASFNPNTSWKGTWVLENDGTVLVSKSSTSGSKFNTTIGTIVGEETHTLIVDEIPKHTHKGKYGTGTGTSAGGNCNTSYWFSNNYNEETGGDQPHNNVQPSKIVYRWHRTA